MEAHKPGQDSKDFVNWGRNPSVRTTLDNVLNGADDGELYIESAKSESLHFTDGRLNASTYSTAEGFGLRAVCGQQIGFAHSNEFSDDAINRAAEAVSTAKKGHSGKWDVSPVRTNKCLYVGDDPIEVIDFARKVQLLQDINSYARAQDERVIQVSTSIQSSWSEIYIFRAGGEEYADLRPMVRLQVMVHMAAGGRQESGQSAFGGRYMPEIFLNEYHWKKEVDEAVRMASTNLASKPAPAGEMDVVLGPGWPAVMLHEAVGHGLESDLIRKGQSAYSELLGAQVAAKGVTIIDDGTFANARGSLTIDDEGTPSERTVLVEDGMLVGFMQDRQNARLMGSQPTGNGRRQSYAHTPMPRMTNTYMENGEYDPSEVLASVKDGIYVADVGGGSVDVTSGDFVFSCTEAYRVRNGVREEPIKGATLIGNGPKIMKKVAMIGNDMQLDRGIAACGKAGQTVPVGVGQPTLRLNGVTVGGTG